MLILNPLNVREKPENCILISELDDNYYTLKEVQYVFFEKSIKTVSCKVWDATDANFDFSERRAPPKKLIN